MISSLGLTIVPVLLFALAEGPQPSPVSHLQDGGGSFNLTSREEFVSLSLISPEVRGNVPWEADHWLRPGVAEVGGVSSFRKGERKCLIGEARGGGPEPECRARLHNLCDFLVLIYLGRFRVENGAVFGYGGPKEDRCTAEVVG